MEESPLGILVPMILAGALLMEQLDATVILTAMPAIARDFGVMDTKLHLAVSAYVLTQAVFLPLSGWVADRFGAKRMFSAAIVLFMVTSAACGLAQTLPMLVAMRALQGVAGALMGPMARLILLRICARPQIAAALAHMSIPILLGPAIGPLIGGALATYLSWHWIFYVNIPVGIVGLLLAWRFVPPVPAEPAGRLDLVGFALCGAAIAALQFAVEDLGATTPDWGTEGVLFAVACILFGFYLLNARRLAAPLIELSLFRSRTFRVGVACGFLSRVGINAVPFLLPLMLQTIFGLNPMQSGLLTFSTSVGSLMIKPVSVKVLRLLGFDRLLVGNAVLCALGVAGYALFDPQTPQWIILVYCLCFGVLRSVQFNAVNTLGFCELPRALLSRGVSLSALMQQLSIGIGVSLAATVLGRLAGDAAPNLGIFHLSFVAMAAFTLISAVGFLVLRPEDGMGVSGHQRRR